MATLLKRFLLLGLVFTTACADWVSTSPSEADVAPIPAPAFNVAVPTCAAYSDARVQQLINIVYSQQLQASASIGITYWNRIKAAGSKNNPPITWDFADDILTKKQALGAPATEEMKELINRIFCNARVAATFPGGDGWVIRPSEGGVQQNLVNTAQYAAFVVPAGRITATTGPRLFTISPSPTATLNTQLDQYGTSQEFSVYPASTIFAQAPIIVGLCGGAPDPTVVPQLQLGHRKSNGVFEVLPTTTTINQQINQLLNCFSIATGSTTDQVGCETAIASAPTRIMDRLWAILLPSRAYAATTTGGCGGIGGNLSELSPVRPVDPRIYVTAASQPLNNTAGANNGFPLWQSPAVSLRTPKGIALSGIPVTYRVSGGKILPTTPVSSTTAGISALNFWTVSTQANTNTTVTATPGLGGPAVANTRFIPTSLTFTGKSTVASTSGTPASVVYTVAPPANALVNGAFTVKVTVLNGSRPATTVTNYNGPVRFTTSAGTLSGQTVVQAVNGVATASLFFTNSGSRTITASAAYDGTARSVTSGTIIVP